MEAIVSKTEPLELRIKQLANSHGMLSRRFNFQVTKKDYDMHDVIGYGPSGEEALNDFLDNYESRYNVSKSEIKYKIVD